LRVKPLTKLRYFDMTIKDCCKEATIAGKIRHRNILRGTVGMLSRSVNREVNEALKCLDRENPNISMALNRLNDITAIMEKAKDNIE
jgi:hypothetical protein